MKQCCKKEIKNYLRNQSLTKLQEVAKFDFELDKQAKTEMIAFIEGMKN